MECLTPLFQRSLPPSDTTLTQSKTPSDCWFLGELVLPRLPWCINAAWVFPHHQNVLAKARLGQVLSCDLETPDQASSAPDPLLPPGSKGSSPHYCGTPSAAAARLAERLLTPLQAQGAALGEFTLVSGQCCSGDCSITAARATPERGDEEREGRGEGKIRDQTAHTQNNFSFYYENKCPRTRVRDYQ